MITETTKYGTAYNSPMGLQEGKYYELIYEFIDLAKAKGLTIRQAQKLFTDCADAVLDVAIDLNSNKSKRTMSDMDRLIYKLDQIKVRIENIPEYKRNYFEENIM